MTTVSTEAATISVPSSVAHAEQEELLEQMRSLLADVDAGARDIYDRWRPSIRRRAFVPGARNFAAYLALRRTDLRPLQTALMPLGLSSLGRCEGRVRPNIEAVIEAAGADTTFAPESGNPATREALPPHPT